MSIIIEYFKTLTQIPHCSKEAEKLLDFIQHEGTTWTFGESARSEPYTLEGVEPGEDPVWTLLDEVVYYGQASLTSVSTVPIPGAVWLLGSGLIGLVGIRAI